MSAHGARPGAGSADVSAEEEEVDNFLDGGDRVFVLGEPHRPATNDALRLHRDFSRGADLLARKSAAHEDVVPPRGAQVGDEFIEAGGVAADEFKIENGAGPFLFLGEHFFHHALEHGDVAVDPQRQPKIA